jgi:hypothetical protein
MNDARPDRTVRNVLLILLGILGMGTIAVVACCGGFIWMASNAAVEVPQAQAGAELFLDQIADGKSNSSYQSTTTAFRAGVSEEQFNTFLVSLPPDLSRTSRKISFARINTFNGVSQVFFRVVSNGKSCTIIVVKEGRDWKVQRVNVP